MTRAEYIRESNNPNSVRLDEMQKFEDTLEPHTRARLSLVRLFNALFLNENYTSAAQACKDFDNVCALTKEYMEIQADMFTERIK